MSATPVFIPLSAVDDGRAPEVGAKAANLARLLRAGLPVPAGFCVTAAAMHGHLRQNGLAGRVEGAVAAARAAGPDRRGAILDDLRRAITLAPVSTQFRSEFARRYAELGTAPVVVRSSGTAEDLPGHSFAGLYDTFLDNPDADACLEHVKECWASLWTERAFDYREVNRFDHARAGMAVLVQALVPADAAGVVFTADPVSGRRDRLVLEAVAGLADKLVSGQAVPDRFVLERRSLRVVDRSAAAGSGLTDRTVRDIGRLATRVEQVFGSPQDIEWATRAGRVWLVQSRPITTLKPHCRTGAAEARSWEDRQVWSTTNAAEVLPGVLTPMVWSTLGEYIGRLLGGVFARVGVSFGEHPLFGEVAGRVYMNLNTFTGMVRRMPFASRMSQGQMFGGQNLKPEDRARLDLGPDDVPDIPVNKLKTIVKLPGFMAWILRHGPRRGRKWITAARNAYDAKPRPDLSRFSEAELADKVATTMAQMNVGGEGLGYALAGMMYTAVLYDLCRKWLKDETGAGASRLLAGTGDVLSAEAGLEFWRLARHAAASPKVRAAVLSGAAWAETRPELERSAPGRDFLARCDRFLHLHGHHARGELDMANPRWREQPDYVLEVVRNFVRAEGKADPEADMARRGAEGEALLRELLGRLRNPLKRAAFRHVAGQARQSASIRENVKDAAIRIMADTRELLVELGRRLAARCVLARADDIFFLRLEEVEPVVAGSAGFDVGKTIAGRRAEYEKNLALSPPSIIVGRYDPAKHPPDTLAGSGEELAGLAVSPGVVTGPARVILHAGEGQVEPGEILVAPFTDPGWTPYFLPAAGIVMDQGGLLSHGSIVAREYGIPAVVNVGPATRLIKTGQMLQVDGDRGIVRILHP